MPLAQSDMTTDVVEGTTLQLKYNPLGNPEFIQFERSCTVSNLTAKCQSKSTAAIEALQLVQARYPVGAPDANIPLATARGYTGVPLGNNDDDSLGFRVAFLFSQIPWDPTQWHIESSGDAEVQDTDVQYNPSYNGSSPATSDNGGLIPIQITNYVRGYRSYQSSSGSYQPPPHQITYDANGNASSTLVLEPPQPVEFGSIQIFKPFKTFSYVRQVYSEAAAVAWDNSSFNFLTRLNSVVFTGLTTGSAAQNLSLAPGTVLCRSAGVAYDPYQNICLARCTFWYKPEGWQPWVRYVEPPPVGNGGVPANVWRAGTINGQAYPANGTVRSTGYGTTDLNQLLSSLTGSAAEPFGGGDALPTG